MMGNSTVWFQDRGVVSVTGADAEKLLQGLVTNDMARLADAPAIHAGLLSPQGKLMFAFFVVRAPEGYWLETERDTVDALVKRLSMYKLRAAAVIANVSEHFHVLIAPGVPAAAKGEVARYDDPRDARLGTRMLVEAPSDVAPASAGDLAAYHGHRITLGVPEPGLDYDLGDTFPHEADFDLYHGVDFDKGCFVGQEVVARMQHKTVVRKRIVRVIGASDLPGARPDIQVGEAVIGRLGSVSGRQGLAMLRLDRAVEAIDKGQPIAAAGIALTVDAPIVSAYRAGVVRKAGA